MNQRRGHWFYKNHSPTELIIQTTDINIVPEYKYIDVVIGDKLHKMWIFIKDIFTYYSKKSTSVNNEQ